MKAFSKGQIFDHPQLRGIFSEFREALNEEISYIEKNGQSSILLYAGQKLETRTSEYCYRFQVEYLPVLPPDTPCKLFVGQLQFDVTVVSVEESALTVASTAKLPDTIGKARLDTGATILMERLIQRIEHIADEKNEIGKHLIPLDDQLLPQGTVYPFKHLCSGQDIIFPQENRPAQNKAIQSALTNDVTYIWGPPGTGKTTVIGQIIDELYKHDRSVLLVSHTNTAVDGAIKKADKSYTNAHGESESTYPILRFGTSSDLPKRTSLESHIANLGKELYQQKADLENRQTTLQQRIDKIRWVQTNQLGKVEELLQTIDNCEARKKQLEQEVDHLSTLIDHQKTDPSLYDHYVDSTKIYNDKLSEYHAVCSQEKKVKLNLRALSLQLHTTSLEIQKYDQWSELRKRLSKYPSKKILEEKLSMIHTRITSLLSGIQSLEEEQRIAQSTISTYEKKSALGKLFAGKNSILQAKSTLESTTPRLSKAKENLQLQKDVEKKYQQDLDRLLSLQEKVTSLTPSKSKDFSVSRLHQLENSIASVQNKLLAFSGQKDRLHKEIEQLNDQLNQSKASFEAFHALQQELQETKQQLADITTRIQKESASCSCMLDEEYLYCSFFCNATTVKTNPTNQERFSELSDLLSRAMTELGIVDLSALQEEKERSEESFHVLSKQLHDINNKIQELGQQAILNAKIIGTTLAKSYLSESLQKRKFDTVILDEASMASIPALWCASNLAENSVVIVGDFLQLPPIVMAETPMAQKWLGKDIFQHSGMQAQAEHRETCPENFIMLNDQFRMEPDIANIANIYYGEYGGLSSDALEKSEERAKEQDEFYKWYPGKEQDRNIHLIDTESLHTWVTGVSQGTHHSRFNCFSAAVDVELAFKLLERKSAKADSSEASVLIVAPYKPHVEKIKQFIELEYKNRGLPKNSNDIQAGTIHSFQGREADIVIFDLVIDEPHWRAGLFLDGNNYKEYNDDLRKMFNVAITRAKFKLFIVGNFSYCQKKAKNNALAELLNTLLNRYNLPKIDAKSILPDLVFSQNTVVSTDQAPGSCTLCREDTFDRYFMQDLHSFTKRLIIYSPFISQNRLSVLLPIFADAVSSGKKIIIVTKALSDRKKSELSHYQTCEKQLHDRGVIVVHKQGMHEKLVFIDDEIVWMGSLNVLSFTGLTGEFMKRCADKSQAEDFEKTMSLHSICDIVAHSYVQKCPVCGGELLLKESAQGGVYWACVNNDYTRNPSQEYPTDGLLRCSKCGAPYLFSMKKEPRWVCSKNPRHFQKMRRNDLKLEKMAALIPTKAARKKVDDFFAQKGKEIGRKPSSPSGEKANLPISNAFGEDDQLKLF